MPTYKQFFRNCFNDQAVPKLSAQTVSPGFLISLCISAEIDKDFYSETLSSLLAKVVESLDIIFQGAERSTLPGKLGKLN